jgi:hypothetical protein
MKNFKSVKPRFDKKPNKNNKKGPSSKRDLGAIIKNPLPPAPTHSLFRQLRHLLWTRLALVVSHCVHRMPEEQQQVALQQKRALPKI